MLTAFTLCALMLGATEPGTGDVQKRSDDKLILGERVFAAASLNGELKAFGYRFSTGSSGGGEVWVAVVPARVPPRVLSVANASTAPGNDQPAVDTSAPKALRKLVELQPAVDRRRELLAINGGFYEDGPMGLVVAARAPVAPLTARGGSGVFYVDARGRSHVVHREEWSKVATGARHALQSIDRLVVGGRSVVLKRPRPLSAARSAVAITGGGEVLFVVLFDDRSVDGGAGEAGARVKLNSTSKRYGATLAAFAELLARRVKDGGFGASYALNLDGGSSTSMIISIGGAERELVAFGATINAIVAP